MLDRLDTNARALRSGGDPRSLEQLRCDLATDALLRHAPARSDAATGADFAGGASEGDGTQVELPPF